MLRNARKWSKCPTLAVSTGLSLLRPFDLCLAVEDAVALGAGALAFGVAVVSVVDAAPCRPSLQGDSRNPPAVPVVPVVSPRC